MWLLCLKYQLQKVPEAATMYIAIMRDRSISRCNHANVSDKLLDEGWMDGCDLGRHDDCMVENFRNYPLYKLCEGLKFDFHWDGVDLGIFWKYLALALTSSSAPTSIVIKPGPVIDPTEVSGHWVIGRTGGSTVGPHVLLKIYFSLYTM